MPDPLYDGDPELRAEAETLRQDHRQTEAVGKSNGHDREPISVDDFYAYMPMHKYIFSPTRALWPGASVNARIPPIKLSDRNGDPVLEDGKPVFLSASAWLDRFQPVEQMTWAPGFPMVIRDRLVIEGAG